MDDIYFGNRFDWRKYINFPYDSGEPGHQVLNFFFSTDYDYRYEPKSEAVVDQYFQQAKRFDIDAYLMKFASEAVSVDGAFLEMGVCTGSTINFIAALNPEKIIYGFDSFAGLPTSWTGRTDYYIPKGVFAFKDPNMVPPVLQNVRLIKGMFKDTMPNFKQQILGDMPLAFLHIDSDVYQSCSDILEEFESHIIPGTIIVFDEFYNYPGFEEHEFKAFDEFLNSTKRKADFIAFNQMGEQAVVRIR